MANLCKCGGKFKFQKFPNHDTFSGQWSCSSCQKSFFQKKCLPKQAPSKPAHSDSTFNPLQAGIAIAEYIRSLEDQVAKLRTYVSDRDALQTQVYSLQERLNELKLNDTNLIHIPIGRGK